MGVDRYRYSSTGHNRKRPAAMLLRCRDIGRGQRRAGMGEEREKIELHAETHVNEEHGENHAGHGISLLTPRIHDTTRCYLLIPATTSAGGALWCHRSHMCQNAVDASPGGPWRRQGWNLRGQRKALTPAAGIHIHPWSSVSCPIFFSRCADTALRAASLCAACKRGDMRSNSAGAARDADMPCPEPRTPLRKSNTCTCTCSTARTGLPRSCRSLRPKTQRL
ncbi:hypothetical protein J3F83DRAFT_568698 [Trichoderma novae-zelandiae]